jgi:peptidoglycan/LPS O-acetylase OafA/YrhL
VVLTLGSLRSLTLPQSLIGPADKREPVLDGIRGVAILLVIFHHIVIYSGMARTTLVDRVLFTIGESAWLGVDLFFVLSGFLITGILYDAKSSSRYFTSFYGRRFLRIFPLYYGFLAAWLIVVPLWLPGHANASLTTGQGWYWAYLSNVQVALFGWQHPLHLGHFWSLAIEEQFYLIWPFVVRALDRRRLMWACMLCFVAAMGLRIAAPFGLSPLAAYVLMPTRIDSLAAGAYLALASRGPDRLRYWGNSLRLLLVGCAALAAAMFVWRRGFPELDPVVGSVGLSILAAGFALLIAISLSGSPRSWLPRILCRAPFVILGQYSYGLYVFHQPITILLRDAGWQADLLPTVWGSQFLGIAAFGIVVSIASTSCAITSWHLWEAPFLRLKRYLPYRSKPEVGAPPSSIAPAVHSGASS